MALSVSDRFQSLTVLPPAATDKGVAASKEPLVQKIDSALSSTPIFSLPVELTGSFSRFLKLRDRIHFIQTCTRYQSPEHLTTIFAGKQIKFASRFFSFSIKNEKPLRHDALVHLAPSIEGLDLRGAHVTVDQLQHLVAQFPNLKQLLLSDCQLTDKHLDEIVKFKSLTGLYLSGCGLDDNFLQKLTSLSQLSELNISNNKGLTGTSFNSLPNALKILDCSHCEVNDEGVQRLTDHVHLEHLNLCHNPIKGGTFNYLPSSLETLLANSVYCDDAGVGKLNHMNRLTCLSLIGNRLLQGTSFALLPPTLEQFYSSGCNLDNAALEIIDKRLVNVKKLDTTGNPRITDL